MVFKTLSVLLTTLLLLSGSAEAKKKKTSKSVKQPDKEQLNAFLTDNKAKLATDEALQKADDLRLQTIQSINTLINSKIKEERKFELYLRLGELYSEKT